MMHQVTLLLVRETGTQLEELNKMAPVANVIARMVYVIHPWAAQRELLRAAALRSRSAPGSFLFI